MAKTLQLKLLIGLIILPLVLFIALAAMVMMRENQTEQTRREIVRGGGKSTIERRVPAFLLPLFGPQGHSPLDQTVIVELLMNSPKIGDQQLRAVSGLTEVKLVDLSDSGVTDVGLGSLGKMSQLEVLLLDHTQITQPDKLLPLVGLKYLKLDFSPIPESNLAGLARLPKLRRLSLAGLKITEAGTKLLAGCPNLETLNLSVASLGDHGLVPLQSLKKLQVLTLAGATFSPEDLQAFQKAVPACKVDQ